MAKNWTRRDSGVRLPWNDWAFWEEPAVSVLKIHLTYHCSAQCEHCHLRGRLAPAPVIDLDLALSVIRELQRLKFRVDRDTERLERPRRWMYLGVRTVIR